MIDFCSIERVSGQPPIILGLVVHRVFAHAVTHVILSYFVVEEDDAEPRQSWDHEVWESNHSGSKDDVQPRHVREGCNEACLKHQSDVSVRVNHALLTDGQTSGLRDDQISPLHGNDRSQEGRLSVVKSLNSVAYLNICEP